MSDDLLGTMLGGDGETPEAAPAPTLGAGSFAAALAASQVPGNPEAGKAATDFLRDQSQLLREQADELKHERALRLSLMRGQRAIQRLRLVLQSLLAAAGTVIAAWLLFLVVGAATSRSVVVDDFDAPTTLAPSGVTGKVLAVLLLDELQKLQAATRATTAALTTVGAWATDIKIQVPETVISIGEIDRLLHRYLGHDLHIDGTLIAQPNATLQLTVRGDGIAGRAFSGPAANLEALLTQAAEYLYGQSQPARYVAYLSQAGRTTDALAFLPGAYASTTTDTAHALLANSWGNVLDDTNKPVEALEKFRLAMSLAPPHSPVWWLAWENILGTQPVQSEEENWRAARAFLDEADRAPPGERPELRRLGNAASTVWDVPLFLSSLLDDVRHSGNAGSFSVIDGPNIADTYTLLHDPAQAARYMAQSDPKDIATIQEARIIAATAALNRNDPAAAVSPMQQFYTAWLADPSQQVNSGDLPCLYGLALGLAGRVAEAETVFNRVGDWSRCYAFRGTVLATAGDAAAAHRVWNTGLARAPDLPWIYLHRGLNEMKTHDLAAATTDFARAHANAPHWADPLKAWGDALMRAGRAAEARAKYEEALRYAPAWADLRAARAEAARSE